MILVRIDLFSARTHQVTRLATVHIANDGTGTDRSGNYTVKAFGKRGPLKTLPNRVMDFPRKRKSALHLLKLALMAAGYCLCLSVAPAQAQHIDLGFDVGKAYSIVDGAFVPSVIPSITFLFGPIEVSTGAYFYGGRFFEQDSKVSWYQRENSDRRWSLYASLGHYGWPGGSSINGQAGLRWRLR